LEGHSSNGETKLGRNEILLAKVLGETEPNEDEDDDDYEDDSEKRTIKTR
jgi:hypothetical protein